MTLDSAALDSLRELGGDEFVAEVIDTFLADAPALLALLRNSDVAEVRRGAHTLKSNGLTLGAENFAAACAELEDRARSEDLSNAPELANRIESLYPQLVEDLAPFRGR